MRSGSTILVNLPFLVSMWVRIATATPTNYTIDDTYGDSRTGQEVIYQPQGLWTTQTCTACQPYPDPSHVMNQTFHAATWVSGPGMNITMNFSGTAVFVFFNLVNNPLAFSSQLVTTTAVNFIVDGILALQFQHVPTRASEFLFQTPVFVKRDLAEDAHTLVISGSPKGNGGIYVNFDYATYTHDDDFESAPSSAPVPGTTSSAKLPSSSIPQTASKLQKNSSFGFSATSNSTMVPVSSKPVMSVSNSLATMTVQSSPVPSVSASGSSIIPTRRPIFSSPSSSSRLPRGAVIALGSVTSVALFLVAIMLVAYRRQRQRKVDKVVPYVTPKASAPSRSSHAKSTSLSLPSKNSMNLLDRRNTTAYPIRRAHQEAIERRLITLEQGIMKIATSLSLREINIRRPGGSVNEGEMTTSKMRERMNIMRTQAEYLEQHRHSEWAAGLTDDIPPGYTADDIL